MNPYILEQRVRNGIACENPLRSVIVARPAGMWISWGAMLNTLGVSGYV
jgi:hypothetical protein